MKANARRPCSVAVLRCPVDVYRRLALESMTDQLPMHKIFGVQNRQPGNSIETRRNQIKVVIDSNDIRVGIVGVENGIVIAPVPCVRIPHL